MPFEDRLLTCMECNVEFTYEATEQELHQSLGYSNEPKRCPSCREAKKARVASGRGRFPGGDRGGFGGPPRSGGSRENFSTPCADCGGEARVPFKPRFNRPVYCNNCFPNHRSDKNY